MRGITKLGLDHDLIPNIMQITYKEIHINMASPIPPALLTLPEFSDPHLFNWLQKPTYSTNKKDVILT